MTGAEFLAYVKRKFMRTDKDTEIYEATTDVIQDIRDRFISEIYTEEAYSTIDTLGNYKIAFPSDMGHFIGEISLTETDGDQSYQPLRKISKLEYDGLYKSRLLTAVGNRNSSVPKHFCISGQQIFVGPVPDKITYRYQMNYSTEDIATIVAGTDPVPFTEQDGNRNTLRQGVLAELHDGMENYTEAGYWTVKFRDGFNTMMLKDQNNTADTSCVKFRGV